ncbi:MAG: hypothetical protein CL868_00225 [Cytophagaceae bacterium]|nr:hypothetical protein [Cytophagaceae bacterium]|tara:strand:- start:238 stop:1248 length:1011 start_codon:yes stop_codon:yes gene_type:complete
MNYLLLIIGILIYLTIVVDMIMTTVTVKGGGWLTNKISKYVWKFFLRICINNGKSKFLTHVGYLLLLFIIIFWVFMLNVSFTLVLLSDDSSIINSTTKQPADIWEKIYYSGFSLSTLGIGDYIANSNGWRFVTILYSFTGLILITMSITYFIPVLNAVIKKRKLGILLSSLGKDPQGILLNAWNEYNWDAYQFQLLSLSDEIVEHSQNHRAYPIIHYFYNNKKEKAIILQIARLNEAIFILKEYIKQDIISQSNQWNNIDVALDNYVEVVIEVSGAKLTENTPRGSSLNKLKKIDLIRKDIEIKKPSEKMQKRRMVLYHLVKEDGWDWKDVLEPSI